MTVVLDAGALIAVERGDRRVAAMLAVANRAGVRITSCAPVVAQAWRSGARQVRLARALAWVDVGLTDLEMAKRAGELLGATATADVVDAFVALAVGDSDQVWTSDPDDLRALLNARGVRAGVIPV